MNIEKDEQIAVNNAVFIAAVAEQYIAPPLNLRAWSEAFGTDRISLDKEQLCDLVAQGQVRFKTAIKLAVRTVIPKEFVVSGHELALIGDSFVQDETVAVIYAKMKGVLVRHLSMADCFYALVYSISMVGGWNMEPIVKWSTDSLRGLLETAHKAAVERIALNPRTQPKLLPVGHSDLKHFFEAQAANGGE